MPKIVTITGCKACCLQMKRETEIPQRRCQIHDLFRNRIGPFDRVTFPDRFIGVRVVG